jgi:hypothetical protein
VTQYVTRDELAELVSVLDRRFGRIERWLGVLSTTAVVMLLVVIYIAARLPGAL